MRQLFDDIFDGISPFSIYKDKDGKIHVLNDHDLENLKNCKYEIGEIVWISTKVYEGPATIKSFNLKTDNRIIENQKSITLYDTGKVTVKLPIEIEIVETGVLKRNKKRKIRSIDVFEYQLRSI